MSHLGFRKKKERSVFFSARRKKKTYRLNVWNRGGSKMAREVIADDILIALTAAGIPEAQDIFWALARTTATVEVETPPEQITEAIKAYFEDLLGRLGREGASYQYRKWRALDSVREY